MDVSQLVEAEIPHLRRYAFKLARDWDTADELVQQSVLRGLCKQHLWREGTNLRAWLCTILHHEYINEVRRTKREAVVADMTEFEQQQAHLPAQEKLLELRDVCRSLAKLTSGQRKAVILIGVDGWSYERVAAAIAVPIGTVRSRLSRGRERLKLAA